jgi:hypothetical protein
MPYKRGKLKGQLTTAEIRKLISAHNKLSKITIPPRSTREQIMDILDKNGFSVDHEKELLVQKKAKKMDINLEKAKEVTKRQPKAQPKPQPKKKVLAIQDKPKPKESKLEELERDLNEAREELKNLPRPSRKGNFNALTYITEKESFDKKQKELKAEIKEYMEDIKKEKKRLKEEKKKPVKKPTADKGFKINRSQRTKLLNEWNDERFGAGLKRVKLHPILNMKASEETPALVKQKCKELRLKYHPDKNNEPNQEKFDMVQRACKILLDTQQITK